MSDTPEQPNEPDAGEEKPMTAATSDKPKSKTQIHAVRFTAFPKLLFIWPVILLGLVFWPIGGAPAGMAADTPAEQVTADEVADANEATESPRLQAAVSARLEVLAWIYIWAIIIVVLTLGVDINRNYAAFWLVAVALIWVSGMFLYESKGITVLGDIYRWFADLNVQYNRSFGLAISVLLLVPYLLMLVWSRLNHGWRITHNEFEHYAFGKTDDSLGRGAKTIRTSYPDMLELLLGLAGTMIVFNATGTKELRRIPHVMFLPLVRRRLNVILERTAVTAAQLEEEEDDEDM